jgi:hypothetical protein
VSLVLVAIVLAIGAGAVVAMSTREPAAAAVGLAVALVGSALLSDPLPPPAILGVRVVAALLVATIIRSATLGGARQPSPLGWPSEALLATAGAVAGLGLAVGLASIAPGGPGVGSASGGAAEPVSGPLTAGFLEAVTSMALAVGAGCSLLAIGVAPLVHGPQGRRRAIGLVLVAQAVILIRIGIAGPAVPLEEIASAALLVVCGLSGVALARAAATSDAVVDADGQRPDARRAAAAR